MPPKGLRLLDAQGQPTDLQTGDVITWDRQQKCFLFGRMSSEEADALWIDDNGAKQRTYSIPGIRNPGTVVRLFLLGRSFVYVHEQMNGRDHYTIMRQVER